MILLLTQRKLSVRDRLRRFFWTHPEWWSIVLALVAWAIMVPHAVNIGTPFPHRSVPHLSAKLASSDYAQEHPKQADHKHGQVHPVQGHHAHAHHKHTNEGPKPGVNPHHNMTFGAELFYWFVMVVAMMVPLILEPMRWVAFQSFRHRRHKSMLLSLAGYLLPWTALGILAAWLRTLSLLHNSLVASAVFGIAAIWVLLTARKRALVFCHKTMPLAPSGWKADRDCLWFGFVIGISCVATCGFLMLGCTLTGHSIVAMLGGAALGVLERFSFRPPTRYIFAGTLMLAVWFLLPVGSAPF